MSTVYQSLQPEVQEATVMVVEDEIAIRDGIDLLLSLETSCVSIEIVTAENGVDALEQLEHVKPDLIISDVLMPQMGGYEFIENVRADPNFAHIPVIFLTALSSAENVETGLATGVELYLTKPFNNRTLVDLVETQLKKKQHEQSIRASRAQAMRERISRAMQHELRTPMTLVSAYLEFLDMGITGETVDPAEAAEMQEYLRGINIGVQRLRKLVNDMISVLDIRSGRTLARIRAAATVIEEPARLINNALSNTLKYLEHDDVCVDNQISTLAQPLFGQAVSLQDCFGRIIENAIKFTHANGGGKVTLSATVANNVLSLYIIDDGIGFPNHLRHRMSDLFYQHDRDRWEQQGPGVGLTIAKAIIEAHNGRLQLRSAPNQGTCVVIRLPLHTVGAETPELGSAAVGKRMVSVLLIDDDVPVRDVVIDTLDVFDTPFEYEFTTAGNGQEALAILARQTPDLIVSDVRMPVMDGIEMLRRIKQNEAWVEIPIIFLTGNRQPEQAHEGRLLGVDEYISKPYRPQFLIDRMNTIAGRHFDKQTAEALNFDTFKERVLAAIELTVVDELEVMSQRSDTLREKLLGDGSAENSRSAADLRRSLVSIQRNNAQLTDQVRNATMLIEIRSGAIKQTFDHQARMIEDVGALLASSLRDAQESAEYDSKLISLKDKTIVLERSTEVLPVHGSIKLLTVAFTQWVVQLAQHARSGGEILITIANCDDAVSICGRVEQPRSGEDAVVDATALTILREYLAVHSAEISTEQQANTYTTQITIPLLDINSIT